MAAVEVPGITEKKHRLRGDEWREWLGRQIEPEVVRRRTHRGAIVASFIFTFLVAVVLFRPGRYTVGPLVVGLSSLRNPLLEMGAAFVVAALTREHSGGRFFEAWRAIAAVWSEWATGGRIFALVLAVKLGVTIVGLAQIAGDYIDFHRDVRTRFDEPIEDVFDDGSRYEQFTAFFERVRRTLPPGARVLYIGHGEGQILAYILYPRPVFMQPHDRYVAWIEHQSHDLGDLPTDELFLESYPKPVDAPSLEAFVRAHRITHVVKFVESDLAACRIEAIR